METLDSPWLYSLTTENRGHSSIVKTIKPDELSWVLFSHVCCWRDQIHIGLIVHFVHVIKSEQLVVFEPESVMRFSRIWRLKGSIIGVGDLLAKEYDNESPILTKISYNSSEAMIVVGLHTIRFDLTDTTTQSVADELKNRTTMSSSWTFSKLMPFMTTEPASSITKSFRIGSGCT